MTDVTIHAPPAHLFISKDGPGNLGIPTLEEMFAASEAERRRLEAENDQLKMTASTIANVAICLARMRQDEGKDVVIPRSLSDRMEGAQITLKEDKDGNVVVNHRERGLYPVEKEDS